MRSNSIRRNRRCEKPSPWGEGGRNLLIPDGCGVHRLSERFGNSHRVPSTPVTACAVPPSVSRRGLDSMQPASRGRLFSVPSGPASIFTAQVSLPGGRGVPRPYKALTGGLSSISPEITAFPSAGPGSRSAGPPPCWGREEPGERLLPFPYGQPSRPAP